MTQSGNFWIHPRTHHKPEDLDFTLRHRGNVDTRNSPQVNLQVAAGRDLKEE